jgi:hypothetical protein
LERKEKEKKRKQMEVNSKRKEGSKKLWRKKN